MVTSTRKTGVRICISISQEVYDKIVIKSQEKFLSVPMYLKQFISESLVKKNKDKS